MTTAVEQKSHCAIVLGIILFLVGIAGFIPQYAPDGMLIGLFHVNLLHNLVHILTGIISIWVGIKSSYACRMFFRIFGVIYLFVAVLGFFYGNNQILGMMANNMADSWLHLVIAIVLFYFGFFMKEKHPT